MGTLNISSEELSKLQQLGRGACSIVYKYGTDLVIKVLNEKGIEMHNEDEFSSLIGIENGTCIFPKNKVNIDGNFQAYTMEYVEGSQMQNVIKNIEIPTLLSAIQKVESDLKKLSTEKILLQDLNQGGIMWDEQKECIKIIDTDFFEKNENINAEQCYSANITSFNSMLEMEMGILNGQGTELSNYLQANAEFSKLYSKYMIYSLNGKNMSINELVNKATEIFENDFGIKPNSIGEMEQMINERLGIKEEKNSITPEEIPTFEPPKDEQTEESISQSKSTMKQKIAKFLADKPLLRKIPFIDRFVLKEQRLLPEKTLSIEDMTKQDQHSKFVDEISQNGKYRKLFLGQPIKNPVIETAKQKYGEPHSMADKDKIEQMKKKMDEKSLEDDL